MSADEKDESSFKQESRRHHEIIVNDDEAEARRKSDESNRGVDVEENNVVRIENGDRSKDLVENEIEDIEVAEAHGSDDDVLQEYAIAKEAFSDAMKDVDSDQMVAESDEVSNELNVIADKKYYTF